MKKVIKLLFCILLSVSLVACKNTNNKKVETKETLVLNLSGKASDMNTEVIPEAGVTDTTAFYENYSKLEKLIEEEKKDEAFKVFNELLEQNRVIDDRRRINTVYQSENIYDENLNEIYNQSYLASVKAELDLTTIGCVLAKKYGEDFKKYLNNDYLYTQLLEANDYQSDEIVAIEQEIKDLQLEYKMLQNNIYTDTVNYKGKDYTFTSRTEDESLTDDDKNQIYMMLLEKQNKQFGEVFIKLVNKYNELGRAHGYNNYPEYADKELYSRDYSTSELEKFYEAIKVAAKDYKYCDFKEVEFKDLNDILNTINKLTEYMPKYAKESFEDIVKNKLIVAGSDENHYEASSVDTFITKGHSFIYEYLSNDNSNFSSIISSLGHCANGRLNSDRMGYGYLYNLDISGIQSAGLEALMIDQYEKVLDKKDADIIKANTLRGYLFVIVEACIGDEWQRKVFTTPDLTLDKVNSLYEEIYESYGYKHSDTNKYSWGYTGSNFTNPINSTSSAVSYIVAIQIYELAKTDRDKAIKAWESIIESGTNSYYMETVKKAGLTPFNDEEATSKAFSDCVKDVNNILKDLKENVDYFYR